MKKNRRPQAQKPNRHQHVLDLRQGSRTSPRPSGNDYQRKPKHTNRGWSE